MDIISFKHLGVFEGIGGFSLAARWAGWETKAYSEINPFCQRVLKHHFPNADALGNITTTDFTPYANTIDIITGGFPCQPFSLAGKRKGTDDERHLWPQMLRAIREVKPPWVVGENVYGIVNWDGGLVFEQVQADLEAEGYQVQTYILPAAGVDAPHKRERVWFVANAVGCAAGSPGTGDGIKTKGGQNNTQPKKRGVEAKQHIGCDNVLRNVTNTESKRGNGRMYKGFGKQWGEIWGKTERFNESGVTPYADSRRQSGEEYGEKKTKRFAENGLPTDWANWPTQSPVCSRDDGFSAQLDGITFPRWRNESIKAYGNAIVPQVAYQIFKAINEYEALTK
jgi:DNA (cytosine-5)-methyltransferase 1